VSLSDILGTSMKDGGGGGTVAPVKPFNESGDFGVEAAPQTDLDAALENRAGSVALAQLIK
jgi:hypothetical protein